MRRSLGLQLALGLLLAGCGSSTSTQTATTAATSASTQKVTIPATPASTQTATTPATPVSTQTTPAAAPKPSTNEALAAAEDAATRKQAEAKNAQAAATPAKKLVEAWKEGPVEATDEAVLSVQRDLVSLGAKCAEPVPTLTAEINAALETLAKAGIEETPVALAAAFDTAVPGKDVASECKGILSALTAAKERASAG
jgi:hypothetical protein